MDEVERIVARLMRYADELQRQDEARAKADTAAMLYRVIVSHADRQPK